MGKLMLFTELKKIALVLRYNSSKLATTRKKCPKMAQNRPKTVEKSIFSKFQNFISFRHLSHFLSHLAHNQASGIQTKLIFQIFDIFPFLGLFGLFLAQILDNLKIWAKNSPKDRKTEKYQKSEKITFFVSLRPSYMPNG